MPWNSTFPLGSVSVKANRVIGQQNTTYIETTMGNSVVGTNTTSTRDHFWAVGANEDGRHRFIQSPAFTVGGNPDDPVLGTGMDSVIYAKTTNGRVEWFHRNAAGIYQFIPTVLTGTVINLTSSYQTVVAVPASVYGEIIMFTPGFVGSNTFQSGFFRSGVAQVDAFSNSTQLQGSDSNVINIKFGNGGEASGLNIRARREDGLSGTNWTYIVKYWAI